MRKVSVLLLSLAFLLAFQVGSAFADSKLDDTVDKLIGIHYKSNGTTTSGFDCSGFTQYVFKKLGIEIARDSRSQAKQGQKVDRKDLRAGDLVFFNTNGKGVSHVGIYVGDGKFAHSSTSRGVTISALTEKYYANKYLFARRVIDTDTYQAIATDPAAAEEADSVENNAPVANAPAANATDGNATDGDVADTNAPDVEQ